MKPVVKAIHRMGLKFGTYEDAGYATCGGFAGSGEPNGGGKDHFLQDARLFASWGVDYLKLDGCNLYVPKGESHEAVYRRAYAAESAALKAVGRPVVFSESAPAYFQGTPDWYDVLDWVRNYGQLWREGSDIDIFDPKNRTSPVSTVCYGITPTTFRLDVFKNRVPGTMRISSLAEMVA